jgi:hypothetical protein
MSHSALVNDGTLHVTTYKGSPINFLVVPLADGDPIADLDDYDQIDWSWWTGSPETPGTKALDIRLTGANPKYLTVEDVVNPNVPAGSKGVRVDIPHAISFGVAAGAYYAELWVTPPGGEATLVGISYFNHLPTTAVS